MCGWDLTRKQRKEQVHACSPRNHLRQWVSATELRTQGVCHGAGDWGSLCCVGALNGGQHSSCPISELGPGCPRAAYAVEHEGSLLPTRVDEAEQGGILGLPGAHGSFWARGNVGLEHIYTMPSFRGYRFCSVEKRILTQVLVFQTFQFVCLAVGRDIYTFPVREWI